jgi:hypothetical protein
LFAHRLELLRDVAGRAPRGGLWLEFGVFRGESINLLARESPGPVYGFDTFEGLPDDWMPGYPAGTFSLRGGMPDVAQNVTLFKGPFSETVVPFLRDHDSATVALAHIDCDLYDSTRTVLDALAPRLRAGSVLVFDEYEGLFPDTEGRAFREWVRGTGLGFDYTGGSLHGSLAVTLR